MKTVCKTELWKYILYFGVFIHKYFKKQVIENQAARGSGLFGDVGHNDAASGAIPLGSTRGSQKCIPGIVKEDDLPQA